MSEIEERVAKAIAELEWGAVISPEGWCDLRVSRDGVRIFELARAAIAAMPGEPAACEKCNAVLKEGDGVFTTKTGLVHFPHCPPSAIPAIKIWIVYEHAGYNALTGEHGDPQPPVGAFASEQAAKDWIHDNVRHRDQDDYQIFETEVKGSAPIPQDGQP